MPTHRHNPHGDSARKSRVPPAAIVLSFMGARGIPWPCLPAQVEAPEAPRDPIALAKLIREIASGAGGDKVEDTRNPAPVELGRLGGQKGGKARAAKLSPKKRSAASPV